MTERSGFSMLGIVLPLRFDVKVLKTFCQFLRVPTQVHLLHPA